MNLPPDLILDLPGGIQVQAKAANGLNSLTSGCWLLCRESSETALNTRLNPPIPLAWDELEAEAFPPPPEEPEIPGPEDGRVH